MSGPTCPTCHLCHYTIYSLSPSTYLRVPHGADAIFVHVYCARQVMQFALLAGEPGPAIRRTQHQTWSLYPYPVEVCALCDQNLIRNVDPALSLLRLDRGQGTDYRTRFVECHLDCLEVAMGGGPHAQAEPVEPFDPAILLAELVLLSQVRF